MSPLEIEANRDANVAGDAAVRAQFIRDRYPAEGLFAGLQWRISPGPYSLEPEVAKELESMGRVLLQFNRAANLLYRQSVEGKMPLWVAGWLDQGKPAELIAWQRSPAFKNELPRIIRPDVLLTEKGLIIVELDAVPGGIGLTAWLNQTYSALPSSRPPGADGLSMNPRMVGRAVPSAPPSRPHEPETARAERRALPGSWPQIVGGADGMLRGFAGIFGEAPHVHVVVSEEAATYRPEMLWVSQQLGDTKFGVRDGAFTDFAPGDAVFRFFELFDLANVANAKTIFDGAAEKKLRLTPPPKPLLEEKMLFALLWNRQLHDFWRRELGEGFLRRMQAWTPYTWLVDPAPLPPHAAIPQLNLTDWRQLKSLSQRERDLILKVSGFSPAAWGARGVYLGSDLSQADWAQAVETALLSFPRSPYVLQRFHKPKTLPAQWFDFEPRQLRAMAGRVRLCPYYFMTGAGDAARVNLGGVLATICPSEKKLIHGMSEAILAPCAA